MPTWRVSPVTTAIVPLVLLRFSEPLTMNEPRSEVTERVPLLTAATLSKDFWLSG